jgi:hypothetical protein
LRHDRLTDSPSSRPLDIQGLLTPNSTNTGTCNPDAIPTTIGIRNYSNGTSRRTATEEFIVTTPAKRQRISKAPNDAELARNTAAWITEGIQELSVNIPELVMPFDPVLTPVDAAACTAYLWNSAEEIEKTSTSIVWSLRFLAACASQLSTVILSPELRTDGEVSFWLCLRVDRIADKNYSSPSKAANRAFVTGVFLQKFTTRL